jgi:hypothetical protein
LILLVNSPDFDSAVSAFGTQSANLMPDRRGPLARRPPQPLYSALHYDRLLSGPMKLSGLFGILNERPNKADRSAPHSGQTVANAHFLKADVTPWGGVGWDDGKRSDFGH